MSQHFYTYRNSAQFRQVSREDEDFAKAIQTFRGSQTSAESPGIIERKLVTMMLRIHKIPNFKIILRKFMKLKEHMRESSLRYRPNIRVPIFVQTVMLRHALKMARSDPLHRQHLPSFLRLGWLRPGVSGQLGGEGIAEAGVFPFFFLLEALLKIVF